MNSDVIRATKWNRENIERRRQINRESAKRLYHENPAAHSARSRRSYKCQKENAPHKILFNDVRRRAARSGLEFSLALDSFVIPEFCPVLGIPLSFGVGAAHEGSPSVDRIDPSKGYTPTNVRIISWRANRIKSDGTLEELRRIVEFLERSK